MHQRTLWRQPKDEMQFPSQQAICYRPVSHKRSLRTVFQSAVCGPTAWELPTAMNKRFLGTSSDLHDLIFQR